MTDITKKVHRLVPPNERSQSFTQVDASAGDVIMVKESLGHPASRVLIEADAVMTVRFNVYHYVFAVHDPHENIHVWGEAGPNLATGQLIKDNEGVEIGIAAGGTLELDDDIPVKDIELLTVSGDFTVTVM